uniref:Uncharacterized protein LOC111126971 n=1 Tax=Crassostrea virginica TaxID=6565 RepID=A0A8B8DKX6_CRAVI|nr:uncharacterized protein LOC111126971 [Crassostrea virginica]XP_022327641.1 uncharacterized protein LOC111126971 [Crassostrea virginica]
MELISRSILMLTSFASIVVTQSLVSESDNSQCGIDLVQCIANQVFTELKPKFLSLEGKYKNLELAVNLLKQQMQVQQNRKDLRCESGNVGQHYFPAPAWPYITKVTFQSPFEQAPTVTFGLYHLDSKWDKNLRVKTDVYGVSTTGFQIKITLWEDTILYGARVHWMACGK